MTRVKLDMPKSFLFTTEIHVRITDINYGGHLGNDALLSILHEARVRFLNHYGYSEIDVEGVGIIMADVVVVYKSEIFYGDVLQIQIGIDDIQKVGCDIYYQVTNKKTGKEVSRAKTGIVFFDYGKRKSVEIPEQFLLRLKD